VTAEAEDWYLSGTPLTYAGHLYYPAGPRVHFIPSEMVRSGDFRGVPLYSRTTIEPYSVVFVPVGGGLMQPYERRREGELAGTVGSSAPSFPVAMASDDTTVGTVQAQGPPQLRGQPTQEFEPAVPEPTGTSGRSIASSTTSTATGRRSEATRRSRRPDAANGIYVVHENARWFSSGPPVPYDPARFARTGELEGLPVYRDRSGTSATIYVPVTRDAAGALAPYTRRSR
jgi:hypothetical protein